jgi:hypothetical protein
MKRIHELISNQLAENRNKNLFFKGKVSPLNFTPETIEAIRSNSIKDAINESTIEYVSKKAMEEFCSVNQYYSFDAAAQSKLKSIYRTLFDKISSDRASIEDIAKAHYSSLMLWLQNTNTFAKKIYASFSEYVEPTVCAEYSAEFQINILGISISDIASPLLDIGCGKQGNLVKYLRDESIEAYGIDRFQTTSDFLINDDWLRYDYGIRKWGTIISNMGFSNHFHHHNLRDDGNHIAYAQTYMAILKSLKNEGKFIYAPALPFVEKYLSNETYLVEHSPSKIQDLQITSIQRKS